MFVTCSFIGKMVLTEKKHQDIFDTIYENVKSKDGLIKKSNLIEHFTVRGILQDDPRISKFQESIASCGSTLDRKTLVSSISKNIPLFESAFTNSNVNDDFESFSNDIREIYSSCKQNTNGKLLDIQELVQQNPDHFGLSVCTVDGQRLNIGDTNVDFCLQSCVKPINYCLALEEHGAPAVHTHVGREPSGVVFNALKLNKVVLPHNPLVNSGAIIICFTS